MVNHEALMDGFLSRVKQAGKAGLVLHRIGKSRNYMVGGGKSQAFMADRMLEQPGVSRRIDHISKSTGYPREGAEGQYRSMLMDRGAVGTVSKGKGYTDRQRVLDSRDSVRDVVHHEAFHRLPVVGNSETLAHLYGGLKSQKDKLSLRGAIRGYKHLWRTRPDVARRELFTLGLF